MTTWNEFSTAAPHLASAVRARFTAHKHHVLATLRADGSPRVSGTEVEFTDGGQARLGSMLGAVKVLDLQRDGRCALHSNPGHHTMEGGDAKIGGRAIEITDPAVLQPIFEAAPDMAPYHVFDIDITEVVLTSLVDDHMQIDLWRPGHEVRTVTR
ncbi:pyridoxamine 5'-phosphate oxidase family protein [Rhodococcus sp. KRD162]|uniref:pyridoxamine 5'-phosphate oxidase family protein n=1 Tax=Rhodococcus sp. KRD162 TaxID=2729725 RepID=UPI0019CFF3AF|nr:pyridoxamine 5'-phosphate oxidase family protein [Rhodococcus sp. KRD162]